MNLSKLIKIIKSNNTQLCIFNKNNTLMFDGTIEEFRDQYKNVPRVLRKKIKNIQIIDIQVYNVIYLTFSAQIRVTLKNNISA